MHALFGERRLLRVRHIAQVPFEETIDVAVQAIHVIFGCVLKNRGYAHSMDACRSEQAQANIVDCLLAGKARAAVNRKETTATRAAGNVCVACVLCNGRCDPTATTDRKTYSARSSFNGVP
jgi:hypothetical protein